MIQIFLLSYVPNSLIWLQRIAFAMQFAVETIHGFIRLSTWIRGLGS